MVETLSDYLRTFTTTQLNAGTIGKIIGDIVAVKKIGHGSVTISIYEGKITEICTCTKDRDIKDFTI
jgi:hypothetical protein